MISLAPDLLIHDPKWGPDPHFGGAKGELIQVDVNK